MKRDSIDNVITKSIRVFILIAICCAFGMSKEIGTIVSMLPFSDEVTSFLENGLKLADSIKNSPRVISKAMIFGVYSDIAKMFLRSIVCWVFRLSIVQMLFGFLWPNDDSSDLRDIYEHKRGFNTQVRYFVSDLIATTLSGLLFAILFEGNVSFSIRNTVIFSTTEPALPGISLTSVQNAKAGILDVRIIVIAVLYLILLAAIAMIRVLTDKHAGKSFILFTVGSRLFGKVGSAGFCIYLFIKDIVTTFLNSMIITLVYMCFSTPELAGSSAGIITVLLGISILMNCICA